MSDPAVPVLASPLGTLTPDVRTVAIAALLSHLPSPDAVTILCALAGSREEVAALPWDLQVRGERAMLDSFDGDCVDGVMSRLGIAEIPATNALRQVEAELNGGTVDDAIGTLKRWTTEQESATVCPPEPRC